MTTAKTDIQKDGNPSDHDVVKWYALTHLDPDELKKRLDEVNEKLKANGSDTFYDYFIPYSFLRQRSVSDDESKEFKGSFTTQDVKDNNRIRNTLHRFVFIKATGNEIRQLLDSQWNKESYIRLQPYSSTADNMKFVPNNMMDSFMSACYDQREKFELTPYFEEVGIGADVVICEGKFKSAKAKVKDYVVKNDGLCLTLTVELFARSVDITLYDYDAKKVAMSAEDSRFISRDYADYIESRLLDILSRRVNHKETEETHKADLLMLSKIWRYRPTGVDDKYMQARVTALSLICARLRFDVDAQQTLLPKVDGILARLEGMKVAQRIALAMAISHIALYIATKDPSHRLKAKELVFQHTEDGHPLRRFISLIRR